MATELWLNFKDENGETQRVLVEGEKFAIGRTPDNDLQIPLNNLSRQHAQIQRFAEVFIISDCDSSNGTTLNDENLEKPIALKNGDKVNLGGAVEIEIELVSDKPEASGANGNGGGSPAGDSAADNDEEAAVSSGASAPAKSASASSDKGGIPLSFFIIAPVLGIVILLLIGGIVLWAGGKKGPEVTKTENNYSSPVDEGNENIDPPTNQKQDTPEKVESPTPVETVTPVESVTPVPTATDSGPIVETTVTTTTKVSPDVEKVEVTSISFLRRISQNDPKAFLTDAQITLVLQKINQFKGSVALADNIRNAKKNSAEIQNLAASKDLKPQFLTNVALTKLGNQRGDIVATAGQILESLSAISKAFGTESSDECLLVVAAFSNNTSGESLQSTAGNLGLKFPSVSPRTTRSIWFFKEKEKLTSEQFDFALRFLAIGAITQNPKAFNVQAEALIF